MTHTPGPWIVMPNGASDSLLTIQTAGYPIWRIATVQATNAPIGDANARLIAAAPEMLEALLVAETALNNATSGDEYSEFQDDIKAIRSAIAKATGGP